MKIALTQAKAGRLHILDEMEKTISEPRSEMSEYVLCEASAVWAVSGNGKKPCASTPSAHISVIKALQDAKAGLEKALAEEKEELDCHNQRRFDKQSPHHCRRLALTHHLDNPRM